MRRLTLLALLACGCAPAWQATPHDVRFQRVGDLVAHDEPEPYVIWDWWDVARHSTVVPLGKLVSPARLIDRISGGRPALDVNDFGEVPDSPWFTNRIGRMPMDPEAVAIGPNTGRPPADGPLVVISGKPMGVTPGVVVRDVRGVTWFLKFDPPAHPELASGAEAVASRVLHAAGYNVPQTFVVDFDLKRLEPSPDARTPNKYRSWVPLDGARLSVLLGALNPDPQGRVRGLFSRQVPGALPGPFEYRGQNRADPNALVPAQRRRSLRGLWVLMAWLNNSDTRMNNSMDTFIRTGDGKGLIHHYLIDFGDSLGSSGRRAKARSEGYEHRVDWAQIGVRIATLGMFAPYWASVRRSANRTVGIFEAEVFDPARWSPLVPNPAFDEATALDTFWGAAILARFDEPRIRAAVSAGRFSDPAAIEEIVQVLEQRRAKLLRYAFEDVLPLVDPKVEGCSVRFEDLEGATGPYRFVVDWHHNGSATLRIGAAKTQTPRFDLCHPLAAARAAHGRAFEESPFVTLTVEDRDRRLKLRLRRLEEGRLLPIALEREVR